MESMTSAALSIGSTTAMGVEDDANSFAMGTIQQVENDENSYHTPTRTSSLPFCGSRYEPECDPNLQPVIGMQFDTWEEGVNNHRSCVTFGAAFLWNEKKESYIWLFKTFLKAILGLRLSSS
ncbi:uncharacterized protein [Triticum aestivum]|uniref:uncharacterized protein isoform X2 n=1 Tax=Triticum aestivum TaxID=4565 RepID=UPI001D018E22|nr:uncharacterized protein LOC123180199 isoform X2 [Triticum aestivum]